MANTPWKLEHARTWPHGIQRIALLIPSYRRPCPCRCSATGGIDHSVFIRRADRLVAGGVMAGDPRFWRGILWSHRWDPPSDAFGALAPIYGTLITALIALWIAAPISFGIAFFLTELSPAWLRRPLGAAIELLAAIPSIVYGMWGLMVFAPVFAEYIQQPLGQFLGPLPLIGLLFQGPPIGIGLLCAGIILAIMIIPYIASVMCEVFALTPVMLKESAYGIGCTTWEVMRYVVLPYTQSGVMGGVILGLGRALGETMAV